MSNYIEDDIKEILDFLTNEKYHNHYLAVEKVNTGYLVSINYRGMQWEPDEKTAIVEDQRLSTAIKKLRIKCNARECRK